MRSPPLLAHSRRQAVAKNRSRSVPCQGYRDHSRRVIDLEAHHVALRVKIDVEAGSDFPRLGSRFGLELDIEIVRPGPCKTL
jgi:hypothetical protein